MCNIKLKVSQGDQNLELEMIDFDESMLKYVIDRVSGVLGVEQEQEQKDPVESWKEGYQALMTDKKGLHEPGSEFKLPSKEQHEEVAANEEAIEPLLSYEEKKVTNNITPFNRHEGKKQCWYICECGNKGKHYISNNREFVSCHVCPNRMMVRLADPRGPEYKDDKGNYYIAGEYRKTMKDKEDEEQFWKVYQTS